MQNTTEGGNYRFTTLTFQKIGGGARKLEEFTPVSVDGSGRFGQSSFYLTFYDRAGAQRRVKDDTQIASLWPAAILDPAVSNKAVKIAYYYKDGDAKSGWYLQDDYNTGKKYCLNKYELNDGDGFQLYNQSTQFKKGVYLTCAGEVVEEISPITVQSGYYSFTGNMTVGDVELGQLTPISVDGSGRFGQSSFYLTFYDRAGAQRRVKDDTQIASLWPAAILDPAVSNKAVKIAYYYKDGDAKSGWYLQDDYNTGRNYCLNKYVLKPGDGFQMYAQATQFKHGVTINLPSAIKKTEE